LEQLDRDRREAAMVRLHTFAAEADILLADNLLKPEAGSAVVSSSKASALPGFNRCLFATADVISREHGEAPSISLEDLFFTYPTKGSEIFAASSYRFNPGVVYLLKAPNGSGKSTLARLLIGLLRPTSGRIALAGDHLKSGGSSPLFYVFQNPHDQVYGRSVRDYLRRVSRLASARDQFRFPAFGAGDPIKDFGLSAFEGAELWDLPLVALKRVGLAAAFLSQAPWLFFDEPALGLDDEGREALATLFTAAAAAGRGIIVVTHGSEFDALACAQPITILGRRLRDRNERSV
jgi:ABC-type multidrug transport system ATPase subunit